MAMETSKPATSKPASEVSLQISPNYDPNGRGGSDWANASQIPWLPGQFVDLTAKLVGPATLVGTPTYSWVVAGRAFRDYNVWSNGTRANLVPLSPNDGGTVSGDLWGIPTGTSKDRIAFFWSAATGGESATVTVTSPAGTFTKKVTFNVIAPISKMSIYYLGNSQYNAATGQLGLLAGPASIYIPGSAPGIVWVVNAKEPSGYNFKQGQVFSYQLINWIFEHQTLNTFPQTLQHYKLPSSPALDGRLPPVLKIYPADGLNHWDSDTPTSPVPTTALEVESSSSFRTYQMYLPFGSRSRAVTTDEMDWTYDAQVTRTATNKPFTVAWPPTGQRAWMIPQTIANPPTWSALVPAPLTPTWIGD
jgi:hypothetical protein